jgi:hypothetical protein
MDRQKRFKQGDISRALKGATAAGMRVGRVEIDLAGKIVVISESGSAAKPATDLDAWLEKRDARSS